MKIVNGGRPCADSSTIEEIGLNYCSRVICAAKGFVPVGEQTSKEKEPDSKLMIKLDGSRSVDVPYGINTTWRQLKVCLQVCWFGVWNWWVEGRSYRFDRLHYPYEWQCCKWQRFGFQCACKLYVCHPCCATRCKESEFIRNVTSSSMLS